MKQPQFNPNKTGKAAGGPADAPLFGVPNAHPPPETPSPRHDSQQQPRTQTLVTSSPGCHSLSVASSALLNKAAAAAVGPVLPERPGDTPQTLAT